MMVMMDDEKKALLVCRESWSRGLQCGGRRRCRHSVLLAYNGDVLVVEATLGADSARVVKGRVACVLDAHEAGAALLAHLTLLFKSQTQYVYLKINNQTNRIKKDQVELSSRTMWRVESSRRSMPCVRLLAT